MKQIRLSRTHVALLKSFHPQIVDGYAKLMVEMIAGKNEEIPESTHDYFNLLTKWIRTFVHPPKKTGHSRKRILSSSNERVLIASTFVTLGTAITLRWEPRTFLEIVLPQYDYIVGYKWDGN